LTTSEAIIEAIKSVPAGRVASYAQIAAMVGIPRGARIVVRVLHTCSDKHDLPWWRIIRADGQIALSEESGGALQKELLLREGVGFLSEWVADITGFRFGSDGE
jgi:methylated-DNA-protein-cysteine methyltransferase related protein